MSESSQSSLRFPLATFSQVRKEVSQQIRRSRYSGWLFLLALVLLSAGASAVVMISMILGRIVDLVNSQAPIQELWKVAGFLLAAALTGAVLNASGFYLLSRISERVIAHLREDMVSTALGLPTYRVEEAGSGDLVSRSTDDISELSAAVSETIPILSSSVFTIGATVVALIAIDWQFLLIPLVVAPLYYLAAKHYLSKAPQRYALERASMAERARRVLEAIRGRATVRAFSLESQMHRRIEEASWTVVVRGIRARTTMLILNVWMIIAEFLMLLIALLLGFYLVSDNVVTIGSVTAAVLMIIRIRGPLNMLMRVLDTIQSGYASLARIVGVVADPPKPIPDSGVAPASGHAEMRNVSFSYGDSWAVRGISFSINPGEKVALVGASGAGKTTVAALLAGLRLPDTGEVLVDGFPVSRLSDKERIARLALLSQEIYVFSGTLREDLTLAKPSASDEELLAALRKVGAYYWFEQLPAGLDTIVGARGQQVEPVVAQQLALARVLLLDPAIVVMDEATAEAGSAGAGALELAAQEVTSNRSALIVAHRLDQAAQANRILVMDQGIVVENGTHQQLLQLGGIYADLWAAWTVGRD